MTKRIGSLLIIAVAMAVAACGPSDPMQSREAKECRQLLAVQHGWGDVGEEAKRRAEAAKRRNADPDLQALLKSGLITPREENVFAHIDQIVAERDRLVAGCVLKMKGGQ